jgi:phosphatidylglycerophosphate synthase
MARGILWVVTLLRVALIPLFVYLGLGAQELARVGADPTVWRLATLGTLILMGASDLADGWIARRWRVASQLGAVVDAVADKLVQVTLVAFFALSVGPVFRPIPLWFLVLVFGRDLVLLVGVLMLRARYGPLDVVHRWHGRAASVLVHLVLLCAALRLPAAAMTVLMVGAGVLSVSSATVYALDGAAQGRALMEAKRARTQPQ